MKNEKVNAKGLLEKDQIAMEVFSTTDYSKFKLLKGNRKLNIRSYAKILYSMKEQQLKIPVIVNEKFEIIDGQHRYTASQELGLPVYYTIIEGYGIEEVRRANISSSNWSKQDFLEAYVEEDAEDYLVLKDLVDNYGASLNLVLRIFAKVQDVNPKLIIKYFEEGTFEASDVEKVQECLIALEDFKFFRHYSSLQFASAFIALYFHPSYEHERMLQRLEKRKSKLMKCSTKDDYLYVLTRDIYSFGAVKKPIFYDKEAKKFYN